MVVNVYYIPHVIKLALDDFQSGVNMITSAHYTNSEIKLVRGTDQKIDFLVRNYDRHPVLLETWQVVHFRAYDRNGRLMLDVEATTVDFEKGHYAATLSKAQTSLFHIKQFYSWCCTVEDINADTTRMAFSNRDYGTHAPLIVTEGPVPFRLDEQTIAASSLAGLRSSALVGGAQVGNYGGVHSLVFPLTNYTGTIVVQTSIGDMPPTDDSEWVTATTQTLAAQTGNHHVSITGNFMWVRFAMTTAMGMGDIKYRNI